MKAIVYTEYGPPDVLQLREVEKPAPKDDEILIRNYASTVNVGDLWARNFAAITPRTFSMPGLLWLPTRIDFGLRRPNKSILGNQFAGVIEAVGKEVTRFKEGDPVFGYRGQDMGCYAEYLCMPVEGMVAAKPANMSYEEAATVPYGALTALNLLRNVEIQNRDQVLIVGASGGIGTGAVQLAKHYGAEVTGVCGTQRLDYVGALGADHVIDYTQEDFATNGETYDLIFDILNKSSWSRCKGSLKPNGRYLLASFKTRQLLQMLWTALLGDKKVICALSMEKPADLVTIRELVEAGEITAVVDRIFPLEQTAEAHRYAESGQRKAKIVISIIAEKENTL
jgi:NADPH:quinone reductase-like Zn-dependent oxidoreductase